MHKVSAIIPAFNRPEWLLRAIKSVLNQSYQNIELIVINDASTENLDKCQEVAEENGQKFINLGNNHGPAYARNYAAKLATGDYLAFLDSDDYWLPDKINKQVKFHEQNPELKISQCKEIWYRNNIKVNPSKKYTMNSGDVFPDAIKYCSISSSSVFIEKATYFEYGGYDEELIVCEDYAFWINITAKEKLGLLDEKLTVKHGGHPDQLSAKYAAMDRFRLLALLKLLKSNSLNKQQIELVKNEIKEKTAILKTGAKKRNLNQEIWDQISNSTDYQKSLKELRDFITP